MSTIDATEGDELKPQKDEEPLRASLRMSPRRLYMLFSKCSPYRTLELDRDSDQMPDVYLEIREDEVRAITAERPGCIRSCHRFSEDYFQEISLNSGDPVGIVIPAVRHRDLTKVLNQEARIELRGPQGSGFAERFVVTDGNMRIWDTAPEEHESIAKSFEPDSP